MNPEIKDRLNKIRNGLVPDGYKKTKYWISPINWTETLLNEKIIGYTKQTIYNTFRTNQKLKKNNIEIGYETETKLQLENKYESENILERQRTEYITIKLFDYIQKNYSDAHRYVFRVYYLYDSKNKKITYKELSKITGYSISKCCNIIQTIKKDLKVNLVGYINDGSTRN